MRFFFILSLAISSRIIAQGYSASEIMLDMQRLNVVGSVLYIAAHPDDENTRLITWLVKEKKLRTGYLSITRGDGGQNLIGSEQGELLGLIRTHELLAARKVDGGQQFFTRAKDFGYSKNPEETFRIWDKEKILWDVVHTIRKFKPDIIICRFPTTGEGGHGHHTASAILAREAFAVAGDSTKYPGWEKAWQPKQIYWNTFNFGAVNTTSPGQLQEDVGGYNTLLGKSYGEIAAESRSMHRTQGFGSLLQRGSNIEYFKWLDGEPAGKSVLENVPVSWSRFKGAEKIPGAINKVLAKYNPLDPSASVAGLLNVWKLINGLQASDANAQMWKTIKLNECESLIFRCAGVYCESIAQEGTVQYGENYLSTAQVINRTPVLVNLKKISYNDSDTAMTLDLKRNELYSFKRRTKVATQGTQSIPYWFHNGNFEGVYGLRDERLVGTPINEPVAYTTFEFEIMGQKFVIRRETVYKYADPSYGEKQKPLEIVGPVSINLPYKTIVFTNGQPRKFQVTVKSLRPAIVGKIRLRASEGFDAKALTDSIKLKSKGDETNIEITIDPGKSRSDGELKIYVDLSPTESFDGSIRKINYDHIPEQNLEMFATAVLRKFDLTTNSLSIGYIPGAGDDVATFLSQAGYSVTILNNETLDKANLSSYSAIVTGVRAYNTNEKLQASNEKLLEYVKNGGNLVVQYNTNSRVGPLNARIGPYPFTISRDRVTNENAAVTFKDSTHVVLNKPNKITADDFIGWKQERGIYFATELDKNYQTVLSMNDPGEKSHEGSLIVAQYGKGNFVYTGLAFFRELPAGVPGAYRLFANILSLPRR